MAALLERTVRPAERGQRIYRVLCGAAGCRPRLGFLQRGEWPGWEGYRERGLESGNSLVAPLHFPCGSCGRRNALTAPPKLKRRWKLHGCRLCAPPWSERREEEGGWSTLREC